MTSKLVWTDLWYFYGAFSSFLELESLSHQSLNNKQAQNNTRV